MDGKNFFPENLYIYMMAFRVGKRELADRIKVSEQTVGRWINHQMSPEPATITGVAAALGVSYEDMVNKNLAIRFLKEAGLIEAGYGDTMVNEAETPYSRDKEIKLKATVEEMLKKLKDLVLEGEKALNEV